MNLVNLLNINSIVFINLLIIINLTQIKSLRVENLKEVIKDSQSITIEWSISNSDPSQLFSSSTSSIENDDKSKQTNENEWIGYKIKYFTDKLHYTPILLKNINLKKFRLDNLKSNTEYKIQVSAFNRLENEGPASNLLTVKTHEAVPGEPQDFKVVKVTSNSIDLEWKAPKRDEQSVSTNIKGYEIHYFKVNPSSQGSSSSANQNDVKETQIFKRKTNDIKKLKYTLTDLESNSLYKIQIFAYNMKGDGQRSNPLWVTTLDEGPNKPENIRSEIHNDLLHIKWQAPIQVGSAKSNQQINAYRIYFNNEKYEVDGQTTQITFQRPKWDYDRQYEFRIAAKSSNSKNSNNYGQEAIYRISTQTNQSKIIIQLEKLTSKSVLIKWNNVSFLNKNQPYFKLEYYLKTNPDKVITHDKLTNTELQLINLKPNSDYLVQIVAISPSDSANSQVITSELAVKHFRTLITDLEPPTNLQVIRFEADKINIRWDPVEITKPDNANDKKLYNLIKGYRIYYKEYQSSNSAYNYDYSSDDLDIGSSEEWKMMEKYGDKNTEANLENLNINRDYAIKIVAIDNSNNEGPESQIQIAYKLMQDSELNQSDLNSQSQQSIVDYSSISNQVTDKIGQPRDLEIIEYTSSSVKFSWMPPEPTQSYKIRDFFISYVDRAKYYRETNGSIVSYVKGIVMTIKAPARDDPTIKITWLVTGLSPYTDYDFNISAVSANDLQGLPVYKQIRTKPGRPLKVDAPQVLDIYTDNTVLIKTGNASERNGPILKYWLVVVPLGYESVLKHQKSDASSEDILKAQNNDAREKDVSNLLKYSIFNQSLLSNESAYIAAEFISEYWPSRFILGDGSIHGRFLNRKLIRGYDYKAYIIAFTDEQAGSSLNKQHRPNMLGLGDILNSKPKQIYADGDLFTYSAYSEKFNTKNLETTSNQIQSFSGLISMTDYHNILWVIGTIAGFILIFILIIIVSVNLMQKNKANKQKNQNIITNAGSATSSTTTTTNFLNSIKNQPVDTQIIMNKIGNYTTNTIKKNSHDMTNVQGIISSSSSSSSTTVSPTTALLSCSVNNTSSNNVGSQSSASNNLLLNSNGLLTTASPLRPQPQTESLYTSIEVTQKLLQQQYMNAPSENSTMMMMMNSTTNTFNTGTINRNNALGMINHYDPIEYRRIHHPTQSLLSHPPILIDELFQQLEKLKHQNNMKFSQEYESIEPGQQFTWENSTLEINRQKNRYANVIAYDHSRVILSKLPPSSFSNLSNTNNSQINSSLMSSSISNGILPSPPLPPPPPPPPGLLNDASPADLSNCSDYINANYMDGYRKRNCYIATQGPLPSTFGDFWRMIWEQQTCTIVMMTKLEERSRLKCDQYWPSKGTEIYDNSMQVTLVDLTELSTYTIRTFVISPVNTYAQIQITNNSNNINYEMRREIKHFQFTAWPDHGVPDHPTQFLMFLRRVKNSNPSDSGPVVVHCSAGVGRTGCYIVIDTMLDRIKNEKSIDIYGHVTCLRAQRNYMVQTEDQYIFCYDSVLEASQTGQTEIPARNLYHHLQRLLQISSEDPNLMLTDMELEYKRLSNIKAPQSKFQSANLPANKFKNRLVNILPYEATRVCLQQLPNAPEASGTDYINANFIDGYKYKKAYIATQAPLTETIDDFWRMLWEHNSTIIVMLTKLREMGREKCAQYWPTDRSIRYQYFVVDPIAEYNMTQYILREFKVTDARDGQSRTIRQFQFVDWPEQGVPKSGESIIELIGQVHKTKEQFGQIGPITVHCSAGVGRTGVFITLSIVLERMRFEGVIDVFNTVKVLRTQRPAMVQTEDQYQFCYKSALEYLGTFESYE